MKKIFSFAIFLFSISGFSQGYQPFDPLEMDSTKVNTALHLPFILSATDTIFLVTNPNSDKVDSISIKTLRGLIGGGTTYIAGLGITITGDVIEADTSLLATQAKTAEIIRDSLVNYPDRAELGDTAAAIRADFPTGGGGTPEILITSSRAVAITDTSANLVNKTVNTYTLTLADNLGWRVGAGSNILMVNGGSVILEDGTAILKTITNGAATQVNSDTISASAYLQYVGEDGSGIDIYALFNSITPEAYDDSEVRDSIRLAFQALEDSIAARYNNAYIDSIVASGVFERDSFALDFWMLQIDTTGLRESEIAPQALQEAIDNDIQLIKFTPGKIYEWFVPAGIRLPAGFEIRGNYAVMKRPDAIYSTLSSTASVGATNITVDDASQFKIGDYIAVQNPGATNGGRAFRESSFNGSTNRSVINNIIGNTIYFANPLNGTSDGGFTTYPVGANVFVYSSYMLYTLAADENVLIKNLIVDGNRDSNNFSVDWRINNTAILAGYKVSVENCQFKETPSENITVSGGAIVQNNFGLNLNGSFCHLSSANADLYRSYIVKNNFVDSVCQANNLGNHSEAAITFSINVNNPSITNNYIFNSGGWLFGRMNNSSDHVLIQGNYASNATRIADIEADFGDVQGVSFLDNTFYNCGDLYVNNPQFYTGDGWYNDSAVVEFNFSRNNIYRGRLYLNGIRQANISDNLFTVDSAFSAWSGISSGKPSYIYMRGDDIDFNHNRVLNIDAAGYYNARYGVLIHTLDTLNGVGLNKNISITDNIVKHFRWGISTTEFVTTSGVGEVTGWELEKVDILRNQVTPVTDDLVGNDKQIQIFGDAGTLIMDNIVYSHPTSTFGAIRSNAEVDIFNNRIYGTGTSIRTSDTNNRVISNTVDGSMNLHADTYSKLNFVNSVLTLDIEDLSTGSNGQVIKMVGGVPAWGTDNSGGAGGGLQEVYNGFGLNKDNDSTLSADSTELATVSNLNNQLAAKTDTGHTHTIDEVIGLDSALISQNWVETTNNMNLTNADAGKLLVNTSATNDTVFIPTGLTWDVLSQFVGFECHGAGNIVLVDNATTVDLNGDAVTTVVIRGGAIRRTGTSTYTLLIQQNIVLTSPDGSQFNLGVDNAGNLTTTAR